MVYWSSSILLATITADNNNVFAMAVDVPDFAAITRDDDVFTIVDVKDVAVVAGDLDDVLTIAVNVQKF